MDCRCKQRIKAQLAVICREAAKGVDRAGNSHRVGAVEWHSVMPARAQRCGISTGRGAPRAVERMNLVAAGLGEKRKAITADSGHLRLADTQKDGTRDSRIHSVAATLQDIHCRFRGQRMGCRAHAVAGKGG